MKKLLLLLLISASSFQSFAQDPDPDLFQTWYLSSYSNDLGETFYLADVEPFLSVDMTITDQGEPFMEGIACNQYGGEFLYDSPNDRLELTFFEICLCGTCNNPPPSHVALENDYFEYFFGMEGEFYEYVISTDSGTGIMGLTLESLPGFTLVYQNEPILGVTEIDSNSFAVTPNPVSDILFITSEGALIQSISIYSISGKRIISEASYANQIDVSSLIAGLYFAEITTSEGKSVQKFIKK